MPVHDEMDRMMEEAWAVRRQALASSGDRQRELLDRAHRTLAEVVTGCRNDGDPRRLAQSIHLLANLERDRGDLDRARALWDESVALCRQSCDSTMLAHKVRHLGDVLRELGQDEPARECYAEALELYRGMDDPPRLDLANALTRMAALEPSIPLWEQARELYAGLGVAAGVEQCTEQIRRLRGTDHPEG